MTSTLAEIALDAATPRRVADFWCAVLGWRVVEDDPEGVSIAPEGTAPGAPAYSGPTIVVLPVPEAKAAKNRLHLDLRAAEGTTTAQELERLLGLGARRVDVGQGPDVPWIVLADVEGNEFCLLADSAQEARELT